MSENRIYAEAGYFSSPSQRMKHTDSSLKILYLIGIFPKWQRHSVKLLHYLAKYFELLPILREKP